MKRHTRLKREEYPVLDSLSNAEYLFAGKRKGCGRISNLVGDLILFDQNNDRFVYLPRWKSEAIELNLSGVLRVLDGDDTIYVTESETGVEYSVTRDRYGIEIVSIKIDETGNDICQQNLSITLTNQVRDLLSPASIKV